MFRISKKAQVCFLVNKDWVTQMSSHNYGLITLPDL